MLRLAFDFIITWRETRTRPNAYNYFYSTANEAKSLITDKLISAFLSFDTHNMFHFSYFCN